MLAEHGLADLVESRCRRFDHGTLRRASLAPGRDFRMMKDGTTHLAHKAEHVVDLGEEGNGAALAVVLHEADGGDLLDGIEVLADPRRPPNSPPPDDGCGSTVLPFTVDDHRDR